MKEIPLTQGYTTIVDDDDFDVVSQYRWCIHKSNKQNRYALRKCRVGDKQKTVLLHRFLLDAPAGIQVDHLNGNGLDNRRSNIRLCTNGQNSANRAKGEGCSSRYKGVSYKNVQAWVNQNRFWQAYITVNYKQIYIGIFATEEEAALAYNEEARKRFGEFARLNLLDSLEEQDDS